MFKINKEKANTISKMVKVVVFATTLTVLNPTVSKATDENNQETTSDTTNDYSSGLISGLIISICFFSNLYNVNKANKNKTKKLRKDK